MLFIYRMECMCLHTYPTIKTWLCLSHTRLKSNDEKAQDRQRDQRVIQTDSGTEADQGLTFPLRTEKLESPTKPLCLPMHFSPLWRPLELPGPSLWTFLFVVNQANLSPSFYPHFGTLSEVIENKG